jgi:hypothetical protein
VETYVIVRVVDMFFLFLFSLYIFLFLLTSTILQVRKMILQSRRDKMLRIRLVRLLANHCYVTRCSALSLCYSLFSVVVLQSLTKGCTRNVCLCHSIFIVLVLSPLVGFPVIFFRAQTFCFRFCFFSFSLIRKNYICGQL